jgi:hypothetical protein
MTALAESFMVKSAAVQKQVCKNYCLFEKRRMRQELGIILRELNKFASTPSADSQTKTMNTNTTRQMQRIRAGAACLCAGGLSSCTLGIGVLSFATVKGGPVLLGGALIATGLLLCLCAVGMNEFALLDSLYDADSRQAFSIVFALSVGIKPKLKKRKGVLDGELCVADALGTFPASACRAQGLLWTS